MTVCATASPWRISFENCRCSWNRSSWGWNLKICLFSENFSIFIAHHQGRYEGVKGHNSPGAESLRGAKSSNNVISTSFSTVHLLPTDLRFEHRGVKLVSCPRRHLTSLRLCTSRLSSQNGEICLQKYLPISGKLSTTNYLNKMLLIQSHLTTEITWRSKKGILFRKQAQLFLSPERNAWGTRRDKHTKKFENKNYADTSPWKVLIASQAHLTMVRQYFSTSQRETWSLQWVNDHLLILSIFCTKHDYIAVTQFQKFCTVGWKKIIRDRRFYWSIKASDFVLSWTIVKNCCWKVWGSSVAIFSIVYS